jgi:uncharacterized protein (DUF433 family)
MSAVTKSLRVPQSLAAQIEEELTRSGIKEWSAGVLQLISEALRLRRAPGIVFADSPTGRRAVVAGTGIEVWEIIAAWRSLGENFDRLRTAFSWLGEPQLRAALGYYALYAEEIDARLALEEQWTPERVQQELPFTMKPR